MYPQNRHIDHFGNNEDGKKPLVAADSWDLLWVETSFVKLIAGLVFYFGESWDGQSCGSEGKFQQFDICLMALLQFTQSALKKPI
jgi:hypothetical protein